MGTIIYLIGIGVAMLLMFLLSEYFRKNGGIVSDLPAAMIVCIGSWLIVILLIITYRDIYKELIKSWFK